MKKPLLIALLASSALVAVLATTRTFAANPLEKGSNAMGFGDYNKAEKQFGKAAQADPGNPQALYGLAKAKIRQGKLGEAQSILNQLQQANPNFAPAYYAQGEIYEGQGNMDGAKQSYQQFIRMSGGQLPPDPEMMLKLRKMGLY